MNFLKEYSRINNYVNKNGYLLDQHFVYSCKYNSTIKIKIKRGWRKTEKVRYVPTCVKHRIVEITNCSEKLGLRQLPIFDAIAIIEEMYGSLSV